MSKKIIAVAVLSGIFFVSDLLAGPFGLQMGMLLKDIGGNPKKISHGKYELTNVPKPHSAFEKYAIKVAPKSGLCLIGARGKSIKTNVYGTELKLAFREMEEKLEGIYGMHELTDRTFPNSIWDEPRDWMMGLVKSERVLSAIWKAEVGSTLAEDLKKIYLVAVPLDINTGFIGLEYIFTNSEACEAELAVQEDDAL